MITSCCARCGQSLSASADLEITCPACGHRQTAVVNAALPPDAVPGATVTELPQPAPPDGVGTVPPAAQDPWATEPVAEEHWVATDERAPAGYEVLSELGRGGMGVVYQARHVALNRVVALKMILSGAHASGDEMARFRREAEAIARLQHPGIVAVHEIGEHNGHPFFSLELCPGGSLENKLRIRRT
jgi:hypothetical protein